MKKQNIKQLSIPTRILFFCIGLIVLTLIMVYSIQWNNLPFAITFFENNITSYILPVVFVLISIIAGALLMASFDGKWRLR